MQTLFTLHSFRKRILALLMLVSFLFCALVVRLFVVQIINGKDLQLRATDQWTRDLAIVAPRGDIYDQTGSRLAVSYTTYNVYVRAREVENAKEVSEFLSSFRVKLSFGLRKSHQKKCVRSVDQTASFS